MNSPAAPAGRKWCITRIAAGEARCLRRAQARAQGRAHCCNRRRDSSGCRDQGLARPHPPELAAGAANSVELLAGGSLPPGQSGESQTDATGPTPLYGAPARRPGFAVRLHRRGHKWCITAVPRRRGSITSAGHMLVDKPRSLLQPGGGILSVYRPKSRLGPHERGLEAQDQVSDRKIASSNLKTRSRIARSRVRTSKSAPRAPKRQRGRQIGAAGVKTTA